MTSPREQGGGGGVEGGDRGAVLDHVAQLGVAVLAQRLGERQRLGRVAEDLGDLLLLQLQVGGQLGHRRAPAQLPFEAAPGLGHPGQQVAGVDRQPHGAAGVGDAAGDGLADPPGGVGRELEALAPVELLDRVHQAQVALLDQVQQRQLGGLVLLGDGDHQAQVGLDEGLGRLVAVTDQAAQLPLAGRGDRLRPRPARPGPRRPASMAWARRASSSLVSRACLPMSFR